MLQGVEIKANIFIDSIGESNLLCSGIYKSFDFGLTVEIEDREIGIKGKQAIIDDFDVNLIIEAAFSENDIDFTLSSVDFLIADYSVDDIANGIVDPETAGYSAKMI